MITLKKKTFILQVIVVTCQAKIFNVNNKCRWYYNARLKCKKKVKPFKGVIWCEHCKVKPKSAVPRLTTNDFEYQIYSSNSKNIF